MRQAKRWPYLVLVLALLSCGLVWYAYRIHRLPVATQESPAGRTLATGAVFVPDDAVDGGAGTEGIPPIHEPVFERVLYADSYLKDTGLGLDVEINGSRRFYPFQILAWHEIINDTFEDIPLAVTYSPLTGTGAVYERVVSGSQPMFSVSGLLWNNNTLFTDETGGLWLQGSGESVQGPHVGDRLPMYPSRIVMWRDWRDAYPAGMVLSRETGAVRDYTADPYGTYTETQTVFFPLTRVDARLPVKERVYGVVTGSGVKAYPAALFERQDTVDDAIGLLPVRLVRNEDNGAIEAFVRENADVGDPLPLLASYWFFWAALYPSTDAYLP